MLSSGRYSYRWLHLTCRQTACAANLLWQAQTIPRCETSQLMWRCCRCFCCCCFISIPVNRLQRIPRFAAAVTLVVAVASASLICPTQPSKLTQGNMCVCVCVCAAGNFIWAHAILLSIVMKPTTARGKEEAAQANHSASCSERFDWPLKLHVSVEGAALAVPRDVWVMCKTWRVDKHNRRASDASACSARSVRCQARYDNKRKRILWRKLQNKTTADSMNGPDDKNN